MVLILSFESAVASHESDATAGSYVFNLRTGARRAEHQVLLRCRPDSNHSIWFVALAEEQRALVTDGRSHGFPFIFWWLIFSRQLQPSLDLIDGGSVVILEARGGSFAFWRQCRQKLPHLHLPADFLLRSRSGQSSRQPLWNKCVDSHGDFLLVDG